LQAFLPQQQRQEVDILRCDREPSRVSIGAFLLRRLGLGILAIIGVSTLTFLFLHMVPGDPVDHLAGGDATPEQRAQIEKCMGLDRSVPAQYVAFWGTVLDGTLGQQCPDPKGKATVLARVASVMPSTIWLALAGMLVAVCFALPIGVLAAVKRSTWIDTLASILALSGLAMPIMLLAPLLLLWFFVDLGWLPGPTERGASALILPAIAIGVHLMAMLARMTRSSMIDVLDEDYVRTARAKGLPEGVVMFKHALRNALLPVITVAGLQFGALLSGAIIVEKIFARPGLGSTLLNAITERNYPVVQGCVLVIAVIYVVVNTLVDLAYGLVDPRIRRG
jgi:ABC-type dipeptide/oligopeptide/nickel transport system permease component